MTSRLYGTFLLLLSIVMIASCNLDRAQVANQELDVLPKEIDYNYHVRPILSDKCFQCHGPDKQKANLRLDLAEHAQKSIESGNGYVIFPGKPTKSEVYKRIVSVDEDYVMPPPSSHFSLSNYDIAILKKWIKQGAEYKPHWAYVSPAKSNLPTVDHSAWARQPIDYYILSQIEKNELQPAEQASKETLIRRVHFDLTGLPPTLDEIDEFVNDDSPDAYNRLVDRLLASQDYGERMAADWMDVARYAESDGYLDDKHRDFHPWRDWIINAFNNNMPYDQFITHQLAGDLIPKVTKESKLATAFNRLHKKNSEAGIVFEEYRVEYVADRTNTLGKGILGLTLECARCHDHKYDPISQKEYYQLFAFFNSTFEIGTPVYGPEQVPGPSLLLSSPEQDIEIEKIKAWIVQIEDDVLHKTTEDTGFESWINQLKNTSVIQQQIDEITTAYYPFEQVRLAKNADDYRSGNLINDNLPAKINGLIHKDGYLGKALFVSDYNKIELGKKIGWYDRTDEFSFQLSVRPDTIYNEAGLLWHSEELRLGLKGYSLHLKDNKVQFIMARTWPQNALQVTTKEAIVPKEWSTITVTYDGSSGAEGIAIYIDGNKQALDVDFDNLYKSILFVPDIHTYGFNGITLGARDKFIPFKYGGLDEIKVFDRKLAELEVLFINSPDHVKEIINNRDNHRELLKKYYHHVWDKKILQTKQELKQARDQENGLISEIKEIMVMGDLPEPRPTYVLDRGAYEARGEQVYPSTPIAVFEFDKRFPQNRYGLAQWLFDPHHPLTARVYVNRIWQMLFGRGIVSTPDDFGAQGSLPSHPELLDWLAINFVQSGWDIKALQKLILTSATYMQDSKITKDLLKKDPENILLARSPRYRLPAEMIRDNALAVSGLLVKNQGGPSTFPYQPEGLWDDLTTKHWAYKYPHKKGDDLYRRSLYTVWKRAAPPPFMQIFDVEDRGSCEVKRTISSTPLQALSLLNDPQFVEASRVLAEHLIKAEEDLSIRLQKVFRILTGRSPDDIEQGMLEDFYQEELNNFSKDKAIALAFMTNGVKDWDHELNTSEVAALGVVVNSIMNTSEAYTKK